MSVLDREGDQPSGLSGDVPGEGPSEPGHAERAVGVLGDGLVRQPLHLGLPVHPHDEVLDPKVQGVLLQRSMAASSSHEVVMGGAEQQLTVGNHAFEDSDRPDDRGDRNPGDSALFTGGDVVAVVIGDVLEVTAADQVALDCAVRSKLRVRTAA
ncbi:hypothetical protein [Streptomyces sp. NPDC006610]|uniref:hypothetical protein n=1 Tax=Streptomyces sp. NPDC006610 TaxID=3154584 RepID=UPI0033B7B0AE